MKGIFKKYGYYFQFFMIILFLVFLTACNGITPSSPIIHSFMADDTIINEGESVTLNWSVTDADSIILNPGSLTVTLSGSTSVSPTSTTTYTLSATNSVGSTTADVTITVNQTEESPVIKFFIATNVTINEGEDVTLKWDVTDADSISITPIVGDVSSTPTSSYTVTPTETTTYTLTATNLVGTSTATVTITVQKVAECIDFESLLLDKIYHVGDTFTDSGVTVEVLSFQWGSGSWTSSGYARVVDDSYAGISGNEINTNNVNLGFAFSSQLKGLSLNYGEYGGNLNIQINGEFKNFQNFDDINGSTIGGVSISIINGFGNDKGRLILSGEMNTFSFQEKEFTFLIGGQELWIDHVCPSL
jgi:hypothetical protein